MGISPSRTKTRVRTKQSSAVPVTAAATTIDELIDGLACCVPVTLGHFKDQTLIAVFRRHVGRRCAPAVVQVDIREWRHGRA